MTDTTRGSHREVGRIGSEVVDLAVGVDGGAVTIGCGAIRWRLDPAAFEDFSQLLIRAQWMAAREGGGGD